MICIKEKKDKDDGKNKDAAKEEKDNKVVAAEDDEEEIKVREKIFVKKIVRFAYDINDRDTYINFV